MSAALGPPPLGTPMAILDYLGIDAPEDLHVEAIAQALGATVHYDALGGSSARLVGVGDRAIITIDERASRARQRFSVAHELGHWIHDRGRVSFACAERQLDVAWGAGPAPDPERRANRFAAELLLPRRMIKGRIRNVPVTFGVVRELAAAFATSLTATAIRFVELGSVPAMVVAYERGLKRWTVRSQHVPARIEARDREPAGIRQAPASMPASLLIECHGDHDEAVLGQSVLVDALALSGDVVLALIWWRDEAPPLSG